jgi:hypothetical protein
MSAVALALAVESALLVYLLVEFGDDNDGELEIPDSVGFSELIEAANAFEVLSAPIDIPSHVGKSNERPKHVARDVVDKLRNFRNLIHPALASGSPTILGTSLSNSWRNSKRCIVLSPIASCIFFNVPRLAVHWGR